MTRGRVDSYQIRGVVYCYCGIRIGTPKHNRQQCLVHLNRDPSPRRGFHVSWLIPDRLYEESEDAGVSKALEQYLDFWLNRYGRALAALERRSPNQYRTYLLTVHEGMGVTELAIQWELPRTTVAQWKHRALDFIRKRAGNPETLPLDEQHDPSAEARTKETEELRRLNDQHFGFIDGRSAA